MSLIELAHEVQAGLVALREHGTVDLTGRSMSIASAVAIARPVSLHLLSVHDGPDSSDRYGCLPTVDDETVLSQLSASVRVVDKAVSHAVIYGANTGFGGSANVRTSDSTGLERSLMQLLQSAVLIDDDKNGSSTLQSDLLPHAMPAAWIRATMATRVNQCVRGHSALTKETIKAVLQLAKHHIVPIMPLRGSISASGDLMPLSYLAGALEGNPDIYVCVGEGKSRRVLPAHEALAQAGIERQFLTPRAALGLVNGTAASAATASLAMFDALQLSMLATASTCLVSEGLAARVEWLHPFVCEEVRPHPGQRDVGRIMRRLLQDSCLVSGLASKLTDGHSKQDLPTRPSGGLAQDRYPLRTSPQWLGPQFEDLVLAYSQITTELNSTSDNPVTDVREGGGVYQSGNFQAVSITSAVEKMRSSMSMIGKMLFSQCTEMLNYQMSAGLPPNLAADDPTVSFCLKGLDINVAAYQSELSFLANTMSNHVQSAEMHNQAINSLAFLSTRYTIQAAEVLALIVASVIYAACQAIDLRVLHATFLDIYTPKIAESAIVHLANGFRTGLPDDAISRAIEVLQNRWWDSASMSPADRCHVATSAFMQSISEAEFHHQSQTLGNECMYISLGHLNKARDRMQSDMLQVYESHQDAFLRQPTSAQYLGTGTRSLYEYIRTELGVPIHRGLVDHPTAPVSKSVNGNGIHEGEKQTIGSQVSRIYAAVRDGRLFTKLMEVVKDVDLRK